MRRIKVLHITNFDLGVKIHLGNYMQHLADQGYAVSCISNPGSWAKKDGEVLGGIFLKVMNFEPRISIWSDLKTLFELFRYLRREKFDIVHTHTVKPGLLGRIAAKKAGVPVIIHTVHGFYFYEGMSSMQTGIYEIIERIGAKCSDLIFSQNFQDIETAINKKICKSKKIMYLGNGIDLRRFDPNLYPPEKIETFRREMGIQRGEKVVGFIARWEREKGLMEFLEAARYLKSMGEKARYLIIGALQENKPNAIRPQGFVANYGIERETIIMPFQERIPELISLMDVVVLPSHGREGIPRILMESAAMGKPVVASRVRGNIEAVDDGLTGLLVPVRDGENLGKGILQLLKNEKFATELGLRARQKALRQFDERNFFRKTDIEYRRLLQLKQGLDACSNLVAIPGTSEIS